MFLKQHSHRIKRGRELLLLVSAAIVLAVVGVFVAPLAYGRIVRNTIDPTATVSDNGRHIQLTGPFEGDKGERALVRVTVTQRSTGAVAEGVTAFQCNGEVKQWKIRARTRGKASFEAGPATATAVGTTKDHGVITDAHQWLVDITLEKK